MPAAQSFIGYGSDLQMSVDSGVTYNTVGQIWDLVPPDLSVTKVKQSNLASPNATHEYRPGMIEPGVVTFKILYRHADLKSMYNQLRITGLLWKLLYSDIVSTASYWAFQAFVSKLSGEMPMDDKILADTELCITGKPTFTEGT